MSTQAYMQKSASPSVSPGGSAGKMAYLIIHPSVLVPDSIVHVFVAIGPPSVMYSSNPNLYCRFTVGMLKCHVTMVAQKRLRKRGFASINRFDGLINRQHINRFATN